MLLPIKNWTGAKGMAQQMKALAIEPDDLNMILETFVVEGKH